MDQKQAPDILARQPEQELLSGSELFLPNRRLSINGSGAGLVYGIDFAREVAGFPELTVTAESDGVIIDVGYAEGLESNGKIAVKRQGNPDADRFILRKGKQTLRIFHHRAFRYMTLMVRGGLESIRSRQVFSDYRRFMTGARMVKN